MSDPIKSVMDKLTKLTPSTSDAIEELVQALADTLVAMVPNKALAILQITAQKLEEPDEFENDPLYMLVADAAEAADMSGEDELEEYAKQNPITHDDAEAELFARRPRG